MALEPCPNCSKRISPEAAECPRCGHPLSTAVWDRARGKRKRNAAIFVSATVALVGAAVLAGVAWNAGEVAGPEPSAERAVGGHQTAATGTDDAGAAAAPVAAVREGDGSTARVAPFRADEPQAEAEAEAGDSGAGADAESEESIERRVARDETPSDGGPGPETVRADDEPVAGRDALVREIQSALREAGYDAGPVDGVYGSQTREGIEAYQRAEGLPVTGEPSRPLLQALK